jgi:transcription termination factor Rho
MSILDRSALEQSPLADLHAIASELSLDSYRRLRKAELIDAIIERQGGDSGSDGNGGGDDDDSPSVTVSAATTLDDEDAAATRRRRGRRGGRGRTAREEGEEEKPARQRRAEPTAEETEESVEPAEAEAEDSREPEAEGVVEVLPNGSGFLRVNPPEASDEDVYISAAQVKRCELVSGDRVAGPRRAPRRSERFASLVRVDTINGRPASEVADSARFDDLPAGFPVERFRLGSEDPTLKAIEFLTPFGRGSRVVIAGAAQAGKSSALRLLARALGALEDIQLLVVLAGVRPEELPEWSEGVAPVAAVPLGGSSDAQAQAVERAVDQGRRLAARGNHVVLLIDSISGLASGQARKALASARHIVDGGSLTVLATATEPLGGETTVITLDAALVAAGRFPALDLATSWTMRPELLVGDGGAELIARTRAEALDR